MREAGRWPMTKLVGVALVIAGIVAMTAAASGSERADAAAGALSIAPANQQVQPGANFNLEIKHQSDVEITGVQTFFKFDASLLQIVSITRHSSWQNNGAAFLLGVAPQTQPQAIAEANTTGTLVGAGLFISPGTGALPVGSGTAFTIVMKAKDGVSGVSQITLTDVGMLDLLGQPVPAGSSGGTVTVGSGETATPTSSPTTTSTPDPSHSATPTFTASATPSITPTRTVTPTATVTATATPTGSVTVTPSATATAVTPTVTASAGSASMKLVPSEQTVPPSADVTIHVSHTAGFDVSGAETDVVFSQNLLQIVSVTKSPAYATASMLAGVQQTLAQAIAEANQTGRLKNVAVYYTPGQGKAAAGENAFITLQFKAQAADGTSDVKLESVEMIDTEGGTLAVSPVSGKVIVLTGAIAPTPVPPPVAAGSGATTPVSGVAGDSSGGSFGSERLSSAAGATRLPSTGSQAADRALLFSAGLLSLVAGVGVIAGGWRKRRMTQD